MSEPTSFMRKFVRLIFLCASGVYIATCLVVLAVILHNEWHRSLLRFMARAWEEFVTNRVGSTSPGFFSSILLSVLGFILLAIFIWYMQGVVAMRQHVVETAALSTVALVTAIFLVYGTQFAWEVAQVGYDKNQAKNSTIGDLNRVNNQLRAQGIQLLQSHPRWAIEGDNEFAAISNVLGSFNFLQTTGNQETREPCKILVTAPIENMELAKRINNLAAWNGCETTPLPDYQHHPEALDMALKGAVRNEVVVHANKDFAKADGFMTDFQNVFDCRRSYAMPPNSPPQLIWLQFGNGNVYRKL